MPMFGPIFATPHSLTISNTQPDKDITQSTN